MVQEPWGWQSLESWRKRKETCVAEVQQAGGDVGAEGCPQILSVREASVSKLS